MRAFETHPLADRIADVGQPGLLFFTQVQDSLATLEVLGKRLLSTGGPFRTALLATPFPLPDQFLVDQLLRLISRRDRRRIFLGRWLEKQAGLIRIERATLRATSPEHVRQLLIDRFQLLHAPPQIPLAFGQAIPVLAECLRGVDQRLMITQLFGVVHASS